MRWLLIAALVLPACGSASDARVRFDLASLWQQSAQSVDVIYVRVFDDTGLQDEQILTNVTSELLLDVVAGSLRFEVEASTAAPAPSLFGEQSVTISPSESIVDVLVPVFPAGGIGGTVTVADGTAIPAGTTVVCSADAPRADADAPNTRQFPINADGTFAGTLLDGATTLTVAFTAATPYSGTTRTNVVREQVQSGLTVAVAP